MEDTGLRLGFFISLLFGVLVTFGLPYLIGKVAGDSLAESRLAIRWMRILGGAVICISILMLIMILMWA